MNEAIGMRPLGARLISTSGASPRGRSHRLSTEATWVGLSALLSALSLSACGPPRDGDSDAVWEQAAVLDERVQYAAGAGRGSYTLFEADPVRPIAVMERSADAQNLTRFEGHRQSSSTSVIGHLHESRVTVIDPASVDAAVEPVHLKTHIDYGQCCEKDAGENEKSFAFPTSGVFSADGARFFFSALGSDKVGIVSAGALQAGFDHDAARDAGELREIFLGDDVADPSGPAGLALDGSRERLRQDALRQ